MHGAKSSGYCDRSDSFAFWYFIIGSGKQGGKDAVVLQYERHVVYFLRRG